MMILFQCFIRENYECIKGKWKKNFFFLKPSIRVTRQLKQRQQQYCETRINDFVRITLFIFVDTFNYNYRWL